MSEQVRVQSQGQHRRLAQCQQLECRQRARVRRQQREFPGLPVQHRPSSPPLSWQVLSWLRFSLPLPSWRELQVPQAGHRARGLRAQPYGERGLLAARPRSRNDSSRRSRARRTDPRSPYWSDPVLVPARTHGCWTATATSVIVVRDPSNGALDGLDPPWQGHGMGLYPRTTRGRTRNGVGYAGSADPDSSSATCSSASTIASASTTTSASATASATFSSRSSAAWA